MPPPSRSGGLGATLVVGLVAAAAGFVEISFWSSRTENGLIVECSYTNVAPWLFGPIAVVCGALALIRARRATAPTASDPGTRLPAARWGVAWLVLALGLVHVATAVAGLDLLGRSPC